MDCLYSSSHAGRPCGAAALSQLPRQGGLAAHGRVACSCSCAPSSRVRKCAWDLEANRGKKITHLKSAHQKSQKFTPP